jgi:hypothetical protein
MISAARSPVLVNGLPLPPALLRAMDERRWRCAPAPLMRRVFRETPVNAVMHDLPAMRHANQRWLCETNPAFFGHADDRFAPGDIAPDRSVILGVLGPDLPFALDYRASLEEPSVIYLHSGGDRWIRVARSIEDLLFRLQLTVRPASASERRGSTA